MFWIFHYKTFVLNPTSPAFFTRKNKNTAALVDYADRLSKELTIPVVLGGGQINQKQITEMINDTNIRFISMQRPFVAEGDFLKHWKSNGNGETRCKTCNNCYTKKSSVCFQYWRTAFTHNHHLRLIYIFYPLQKQHLFFRFVKSVGWLFC